MLWATETHKSKVPQWILAFAVLYEIIEWCRGTGLNRQHEDFQYLYGLIPILQLFSSNSKWGMIG